MNFLAHIFLSGKETDVQFGNFIADFIKGKQYLHYRNAIQFGIIMHRRIDEFTDTNEIVAKSVQLLKPVYARFSSVVVDILFDHFLALQWNKYSSEDLYDFASRFYTLIKENYSILPERLKRFVYSFIRNKRLTSYASIIEIFDVLEKMGIYTSLPMINREKKDVILKNYKQLNEYFDLFFPKLIDFANKFLEYRNHKTIDLLKIAF